ncbi:transport and Golgi organization protein 1 isoform X2 [Copidosoma floridanum]|uniref:transport and Golgi organization protein 1 isoform X2 n=1 Tax=Copidosoma floridanum TaxID=29053 RepID=UPI0006C9ABC3|nr:transport and Golgi organization protein 1 isoform X2 [Copidosoma floridanum]
MTKIMGWLTRTRRRLGWLVLVLVILIAGLFIDPCDSKISNLRQCYDETCSEIVSLGKTTIPYHSKDPDVLSFPANADVKIFSKQAGNRSDLWGVEIRNKRGYAPSKFIRETRILKRNLNFTVPTENGLKAAERPVDETQESNTNTVDVQAQVQTDAYNKSEDTIDPQEISPSYVSIYDGTVIPQDIKEVTPSQPSYSTQTLQDHIKSEEEVQLNVYPNILSSTFSAISDILRGSKDSSNDVGAEVASSESSISEQTTEETPTIENLDESSIISEEESNLPESVLPESQFENVTVEELVIEPKVSENVVSDATLLVDASTDESTISKNDATVQSAEQSEAHDAVVHADEIVENNAETVRSVESEISESSIEAPLPSENGSPIDDYVTNIVKEEAKIPADEYDVTVPKVVEVVSVTNNSVTTEADATTFPNSITDKQEVILDSINLVKTEVTTSKVPLKQEIEEETVLAGSEPLRPVAEPSFQSSHSINDSTPIENTSSVKVFQSILEVNATDGENVNVASYATSHVPTHLQNDSVVESMVSGSQSAGSSQESIVDVQPTSSFSKFPGDRNLLNAAEGSEEVEDEIEQSIVLGKNHINSSTEIQQTKEDTTASIEEVAPAKDIEKVFLSSETCEKIDECSNEEMKDQYTSEQNAVTSDRIITESSDSLLYVCITAVTTLLFSLGYYLIENKRRDAYLIAKINKLEKDLMITRKECIMLDDNFKSTKTKLDSIEDESFGSNEMVLSIKSELEASEKEKEDLKDQIASLEKDLEGASEAGLELERMLREILATQSEDNPLAQSIQDLQDRLNDQQNVNVTLTNSLALKTRENETLTGDLQISLKTIEQQKFEIAKLSEELYEETNSKMGLEQSLVDQLQQLKAQVKYLTDDKSHLCKQLKMKELEVKELFGVVEQCNLNNLDFEKLYEVSHIKAEAAHLQDERDELKIKLSEEEGAHQLLEEHVKLVREEVAVLSEQCKAAEKEKKDAETRLEVLTKFFEEKEAQRQKEEALWLEKQGEHSSTVERIQTMQNELLNYKQQVEMLKHEILDQEREYKNQIAVLETKAHEHWVAARQHERRLEEVKAESSQLRNRLTLVEKNLNDTDPENKLHRLQHLATANGDALGVVHPLFQGGPGENSASPLMFAGGPIPPPSYMYGGMPLPPPPHFLPPPFPSGGSGGIESSVGSRPAPLGGGRLSSPPPSGRPGSPSRISPPPLLHHGFPHPHHTLRSPPPLPPFAGDVPLPPPPLHHHHPPHMMPPPPFLHPTHQRHPHQTQQPQQDGMSNWAGDLLPGTRNSAAFHVQQRSRNHKGS